MDLPFLKKILFRIRFHSMNEQQTYKLFLQNEYLLDSIIHFKML